MFNWDALTDYLVGCATMIRCHIPGFFVLLAFLASPLLSAEPKLLLLLGQKPDGHPPNTHEYMPGQRKLAKILEKVPGVRCQVIQADSPWKEGPSLLEKADGVVLFVSEGARWVHEDPRRYQAFAKLAARKGGFVGIHWGIGTRSADHISPYLSLLGACHGGPDRKYKVVRARFQVATKHPATFGVESFQVKDEFYYRLKTAKEGRMIPLIRTRIDGRDEMVSWAWERPGGGRSAGFSGLHFHDNWKHLAYQRLVAQATLWTLGIKVPGKGLEIK